MKVLLSTCLVTCLFASLSQNVLADSVQIPVGQQSAELNQLDRPKTGMLQSQVKTKYGSPVKEFPAKGKPAISRWEYEHYTVYFENDHVIYTVLKPVIHEDKEIKIEETVEMNESEF